jgi:hypothetical protein
MNIQRISAVRRPPLRVAGSTVLLGILAACGTDLPGDGDSGGPVPTPGPDSAAQALLQREVIRIDARAAAVDSIFQPLPLLTPVDEGALRRFSNAHQLAAARSIGVGRNLPAGRLDALEREGRLVRLEDTRYWVIRDLDYSQPLAVPAVRDFLTALGERFQARLSDLGAPPFRMEVSSVLRTAADQEALRRVNPNAALGESTHEYGTTIDILYSAFTAPADPLVEPDAAAAPWLRDHLRQYGSVAAERVAGRRALELKAILGKILLEMQSEGSVMVTLERQQPVFHMTVTGNR